MSGGAQLTIKLNNAQLGSACSRDMRCNVYAVHVPYGRVFPVVPGVCTGLESPMHRLLLQQQLLLAFTSTKRRHKLLLAEIDRGHMSIKSWQGPTVHLPREFHRSV